MELILILGAVGAVAYFVYRKSQKAKAAAKATEPLEDEVPSGARRTRTGSKRETSSTLTRWANSNYVVVDTETTGLSDKAKVVEIAVIDKHGEVLLNTLVNPGRSPIQAAATKVHGITRDHVRDMPTFAEIWPQLNSILASHDLILAYNAEFDLRMMRQSLDDDGDALTLYNIASGCIMDTYTNWWRLQGPRNVSPGYKSLADAADACGVQAQGDTHRALQDCEIARQVLDHMITANTA